MQGRSFETDKQVEMCATVRGGILDDVQRLTPDELDTLTKHLCTEVVQLANGIYYDGHLAEAGDHVLRRGTLTHLRLLIEFYVGRPKRSRHANDFAPKYLDPTWQDDCQHLRLVADRVKLQRPVDLGDLHRQFEVLDPWLAHMGIQRAKKNIVAYGAEAPAVVLIGLTCELGARATDRELGGKLTDAASEAEGVIRSIDGDEKLVDYLLKR